MKKFKSQDLNHEILIWNRTSQSLPNFTFEESAVKEIVAMKVEDLRSELARKMAARYNEVMFSKLNSPTLK